MFLGLGRQKWRFSSDGGAGESWCGMLSSQIPAVPGFPRLKHEQIIPLSIDAYLRGMLGVLPWVKCWDGFYFILFGKQHCSAVGAAGKPGRAPSPQALLCISRANPAAFPLDK